MVWNIVVWSFCLLLLVFLVRKEWSRKAKAWRFARITSSVLAVASLACLALNISIRKKQVIDQKAVVLLTDGYNKDSVQPVLTKYGIDQVYTTDKNSKAANVFYLPDLGLLKEQGLSVHILGNGLAPFELAELGNTAIRFHPSPIQNNFLNITWQQTLPSGEPLVVQGRFANTSSSVVKLVLSGFGTNLDSISIPANQTSSFDLRTVPAHIDKAVYSLTALQGKDTLQHEPVPVNVYSTPPLRILVLAASPDFENKFLRNWLAEKQFPFVIKTTISASKYDKEYNNISTTPLDRISPALLDQFDLLVADLSALAKLPAADLTNIRNHAENKGLGIVVKADSLVRSGAFYVAPFPLVQVKDSVQQAVRLRFTEGGSLTLAVKIEQPVYVKNLPGTQPLFFDQQMRILASSTLVGRGKLVITTLPNSYLWPLSGAQNDYTTYWTTLLTKAARKNPGTNQWTVSPVIPSVHEELRLQLQASTQTIPRVQVGEAAVSMEQDPHLPSRWTGKYWPTKTGWLPALTEGSSDWWYVYRQKDWSGVKAAEKTAATKRYENAQGKKVSSSPAEAAHEKRVRTTVS